jgi:hypothetical protein
MKTFTKYSDIPSDAVYMGSEDGGGWLDEFTADLIADAEAPVRFRDDDGIHHYFNLMVSYA